MEEVSHDLGRLLLALGELEQVNADLQAVRTSLEEGCSASAEEDQMLKRVLHKFVTERTEPAEGVQQKRLQKEHEIVALRHALREKQQDIQEDFLRLLHAEETVACIKRDLNQMTQLRRLLEVDIARLREAAQSRVAGLEAGVMLLLKEQRLTTDLRTLLQSTLDSMKSETFTALGHTHETNYQVIQKHSAALEAYYNDIMQLLQAQRQQLAEEEAALAAGGHKARGVTSLFMSQDRVVQRQHDAVQRRRQELMHTHEALTSIKERLYLLYHFSNTLRVAEFLSKYDKKKYGHLISTNTMQDPLTSFTWPDLADLLASTDGRQGEPYPSPPRSRTPVDPTLSPK